MRLALAVVALAAGLAGGWVLWERTDDESDGDGAAAWSTCTNPIAGYSVDYPPGWYTAHRETREACRSFDPRFFDVGLREATPSRALEVHLVDSFDETVEDWTDERSFDVLRRDGVELEIGRAVRLEVRHRAGTEFGGPWLNYLYVVELEGGEAVVVSTYNAPGVDYEPWMRVVDRAARSVRLVDRQEVVGVDVPPPPRGLPLPEPVVRKRGEIWAAARRNDYDTLEELADDDGFTYTFGGPFPGGPAAYWRSVERKERPLEILAAILELPHVRDAGSDIYVWPDAFSRKPAALTAAEKAELAAAIGEGGVTAYEELDSYLGYRAGIDESGNWVFYVAGD